MSTDFRSLELHNIEAQIKDRQRRLKALETSIADSKASILIQRKRRVLLRQDLRRQIARLERRQKGALRG